MEERSTTACSQVRKEAHDSKAGRHLDEPGTDECIIEVNCLARFTLLLTCHHRNPAIFSRLSIVAVCRQTTNRSPTCSTLCLHPPIPGSIENISTEKNHQIW